MHEKAPAPLFNDLETGAAGSGASNRTRSRRFAGTSNPRHLRVLDGLLRRPMPREAVDRTAGASNGPDLIRDLRELGLDVPCHRVPVVDRDGRVVLRGVYAATPGDRAEVSRWLRARTESGDAPGKEGCA